jgi:hypothetical protein
MSVKERGRNTLPIFIKIDSKANTLEIAPLPRDTVRVYELEFVLTDSLGAVNGPIYMKVQVIANTVAPSILPTVSVATIHPATS